MHVNTFKAGKVNGQMTVAVEGEGWWVATELGNGNAGKPVEGPFATEQEAIAACLRITGNGVPMLANLLSKGG